MSEMSSRSQLLIQESGIEKLRNACVLVVGVGGVGSFAIEALARCNVGKIIIVDKDVVSISNLNRQIHASYETIDVSKTMAMKNRINSYNKDCEVVCINEFFDENSTFINDYKIDFCIDAIDTISSKFALIKKCYENNIKIISCMGMGNRLDSSKIIITTLDKTEYDPLARALRNIVKKNRFNHKIHVVTSTEIPFKQKEVMDENATILKDRIPPSSMIFTPSTAGITCASYVVRNILKQ